MRSTRTPENCAATGLLPMAKMRRPKVVRCSTTPKTTASDEEQHELERDHPDDIALAEQGEAPADSLR